MFHKQLYHINNVITVPKCYSVMDRPCSYRYGHFIDRMDPNIKLKLLHMKTAVININREEVSPDLVTYLDAQN